MLYFFTFDSDPTSRFRHYAQVVYTPNRHPTEHNGVASLVVLIRGFLSCLDQLVTLLEKNVSSHRDARVTFGTFQRHVKETKGRCQRVLDGLTVSRRKDVWSRLIGRS